MARRPRFTRDQLESAIQRSRCWAEVLRRLHYKSAGGNWQTLKKYARSWDISTTHFDPDAVRAENLRRYHSAATPLAELLVEGSPYDRGALKRRLFAEGIKERACERCRQGELWLGGRMALILDHINGVPNDNRIENLRILCPNCAATLATHCGRKNLSEPRTCPHCGKDFQPNRYKQPYCSRACGQRRKRDDARGVPNYAARRVERPPYEHLMREIKTSSYVAVGRTYGVSDNAIRKWVRQYELETRRCGLESDAS
jgi:hypothetical protein